MVSSCSCFKYHLYTEVRSSLSSLSQTQIRKSQLFVLKQRPCWHTQSFTMNWGRTEDWDDFRAGRGPQRSFGRWGAVSRSWDELELRHPKFVKEQKGFSVQLFIGSSSPIYGFPARKSSNHELIASIDGELTTLWNKQCCGPGSGSYGLWAKSGPWPVLYAISKEWLLHFKRKTKRMRDRDHMQWPKMPNIFPIWPFSEKVCCSL